MFKSICGHQRQLEFLTKAIARGRVAHAYIFAGPEGVGKKAVAKKFAEKILGLNRGDKDNKDDRNNRDNRVNAAFHPDLLELDGRGGIKIEQIRELIYKLSLKPYSAQSKVAIIDEAQNLTTEAANALLKSMEEPTPQTVLLLITSAADQLPKTIASRAQKINFGPGSWEQFQKLLPSITAEQEQLIRQFGATRPGLAYRVARDEDFCKFLQQTKNRLDKFSSADPAAKLALAQDLAEVETSELNAVMDLWLHHLRLRLQNQPSSLNAQVISQVIAARNLISQNVNPKLVLTNLIFHHV